MLIDNTEFFVYKNNRFILFRSQSFLQRKPNSRIINSRQKSDLVQSEFTKLSENWFKTQNTLSDNTLTPFDQLSKHWFSCRKQALDYHPIF